MATGIIFSELMELFGVFMQGFDTGSIIELDVEFIPEDEDEN